MLSFSRRDALRMADAIRELDPFYGLFNIPCWFDDDYIIEAIAIEIGAKKDEFQIISSGARKPCASYLKDYNGGDAA